ncbi:MAG: alpha-ketoglutarate-dependent dioxygenase AlkB, partial [Gammaproteobacteria bacterium]|nr:alpha-ketoglutarate-dependent dioxygenase AlkB [Gammaproteobacteria bacterium]
NLLVYLVVWRLFGVGAFFFTNSVAPTFKHTPHGTHRYIPDYLDQSKADDLLAWLSTKVVWHQEKYQMFGRRIRAPRLVAWYGDPGLSYGYSGTIHKGTGWPEVLAEICAEVKRSFSLESNFVLLNRYRDGSDSMGWHKDDESELRGPVASLSLGATRRFHIREGQNGETLKIDLEHGSLLLLDRQTAHALPKTKRKLAERINLTFRHVVGV